MKRPGLGLFLRELMRSPARISALAPSSVALAREMARGLSLETGPVLELGSGTGKITRAILDAGVPPENLTLCEMQDAFRDHLAGHFPGLPMLRDATNLAELPAGQFGAVVSGLPLLSMPLAIQAKIVSGAFRALREDGVYIQFTYGLKPSIHAAVVAEMGLLWSKSGRIWPNLPPATVYRYRRT